MPRLPDVLIRISFALLVFLGLTAAALRVLAPDDLISRVERVRARAMVAMGVSQPAPERRARAVAAADAKFAAHRTVTRLHVLAGAGFLALASLQLSRRVRRRTPRTHRIAGRVAILLAWMSGLSGLFFGLWQPLAGIAEQMIVGAVGVFLLASVSLALHHIRAGRVEPHREWMLRGIAGAVAIASVRLVAIPLDLALTPRGVDVRVVFALSLWIGWIVTMVGAEWWIRSTRARVLGAGPMLRLTKTRVLCTVVLLALAPRPLDGQSSAPRDTTPEAVVRAFVQAFNAHDLDAMLSFVAPEIVWLSVAGDSVTIEARGLSVLREQMGGYFRQLPSARSELETLTTLGPWVSARERAHWTAASGPMSQASLSVYEVRAGLVRRVWYYPVVR